MTQAVQAAITVLLLIAAVCLIVLVVRMRTRPSSSFELGARAAKDMPSGTDSLEGAGADASTTTRRRFFGLAGFAGVALSVLAVRLWSMQVISGRDYSAQAEGNRTVEYTTVASRGRILDRRGKELVGNRSTYAVLANEDVQGNTAVIRRLSAVLGIPRETVAANAASQAAGAQADRVIAMDVDERSVAYISEHPKAFPGVSIDSRTVRTYPRGTLAAHVLGYTGTISQEELDSAPEGTDYKSGDIVGKDGVEQAFERFLQGAHGVRTVEVNASGEVLRNRDEANPTPGDDVRITIDVRVQKTAEEALRMAFADAARNGYDNVRAGAIVCMNCNTGEILAMASAPTYNPSEFINGISTDSWEELTSEGSGYPLSNRCIAGQYPAASTLKGFTGLAGLEYKFATTSKTWDCKGTWTGFGKQWPQRCWQKKGHGDIGFYHGIVQSCDVVFYEIAKRFYEHDNKADAQFSKENGRSPEGEEKSQELQDYLLSWGFGSFTDIELSGETQGRVPTPAWKESFNRDAPESRAWQPGDMSNLIIGQGDLLVTPLQVACGYAGLATGKVPRPVLLHSVVSRDGVAVVDGRAEAAKKGSQFTPEFDEDNIQVIRNALRGVVTSGSVKDVFKGLGTSTSGKTGTGQVAGKDDFGWYVGYAPSKNPKYVCACCIEEGGSGTSSAAPAVRNVLAKALGKKTKHIFVRSPREQSTGER